MTVQSFESFAQRKAALRAGLMALALATGFGPAAFAGYLDVRPDTHHQGPYDNTGRGPDQTGLEGGGG
jgi:hypothetical protein